MKEIDELDEIKIKVEMSYGSLHNNIVTLLSNIGFTTKCIENVKAIFTADTPVTKQLKEDLIVFFEERGEIVTEAVARFLINIKEPTLAQVAIPSLNNVAIAVMFQKDRFAAFAKVVLTTLHCGFLINGEKVPLMKTGTGIDGHYYLMCSLPDLPELKENKYPKPSMKQLAERNICDHVTGSILAKIENKDSDKCLESLAHLMNVKVCYTVKWLDMPEMLLADDASEEEIEAHELYLKTLTNYITEIVRNQAYFYHDLIVDYRLRNYSRNDCDNYTSSKQLRSMLMAYEKEQVKVTDVNVDKTIKIKLPELPE